MMTVHTLLFVLFAFAKLTLPVTGTGNSIPWPVDNGTTSLGAHRFVFSLQNSARADADQQTFHADWNRRDPFPLSKAVFVRLHISGAETNPLHCAILNVSSSAIDFTVTLPDECTSKPPAACTVLLYYMPYKWINAHYDANIEWLTAEKGNCAPATPIARRGAMASAVNGVYDSITRFHRFVASECAASAADVGAFTGQTYHALSNINLQLPCCQSLPSDSLTRIDARSADVQESSARAAARRSPDCRSACAAALAGYGCNAFTVSPAGACTLFRCSGCVSQQRSAGATSYVWAANMTTSGTAIPTAKPLFYAFALNRSEDSEIRTQYAVPKSILQGASFAEGFVRSSTPALLEPTAPGAYYTFQVAVWLPFAELNFTATANAGGTCGGKPCQLNATVHNVERVDYWGRQRSSYVAAPVGVIAPLWIGVDVPKDASPGRLQVTVVVIAVSDRLRVRQEQQVVANVDVTGSPVDEHGDGDISLRTRLRWLNYNGGASTPTTPFRNVDVSKFPRIVLSEKVLELSKCGLPASVVISSRGTRGDGAASKDWPLFRGSGLDITIDNSTAATCFAASLQWSEPLVEHTDAVVSWVYTGALGSISCIRVIGSADFSGYLDYSFEILNQACVARLGARVSLGYSIPTQLSSFVGGWGMKSNLTSAVSPHTWSWTANSENKESALWIGGSRAGIRMYLKGAEDGWQSSVPLDSNRPFGPPPESWAGGTGNIYLKDSASHVSYTVALSSASVYNFSFLLTPVKPLNYTWHWTHRHMQVGDGSSDLNLSALAAEGVNVLNIHQGNIMNPYINYPYLTSGPLSKLIAQAKKFGIAIKLYDTMRELSNRCLEMFQILTFDRFSVWQPLRNFQPVSTFLNGDGGGAPWLRTHLFSDYVPAWSTPLSPGTVDNNLDAAIRVHGMSSWNNYYVYGLSYLARTIGISGMYLDEAAFDRVTLYRARALLDAARNEGLMSEALIDLHSDQGFTGLSPAITYSELMPFLTSLWFGEGFDYGLDANYWFVELSGMPWGLPSDMLRYENMRVYPFKGLLFGITMRKGCNALADPSATWAWWLDLGLGGASMQVSGWWEEVESIVSPVASISDTRAKVSVFYIPGKVAVIVVASFSSDAFDPRIELDWVQLGFNSSVTIEVPVLAGLQEKPIAVPSPTGPFQLDNDAAGVVFAIRPKSQ